MFKAQDRMKYLYLQIRLTEKSSNSPVDPLSAYSPQFGFF